MVDETRDGAVGADGPAMLEVQDSHGVEIERTRGLPDSDGDFADADIFAVRPDGHTHCIIVTCHGRAIAAGLLRGELPGLPFVEGICSNGGCALGILIVTADNNEGLYVRVSDGENSGGGIAVGYRCFRDGPGAARVSGVEDARGRAAGPEKDFVAGE